MSKRADRQPPIPAVRAGPPKSTSQPLRLSPLMVCKPTCERALEPGRGGIWSGLCPSGGLLHHWQPGLLGGKWDGFSLKVSTDERLAQGFLKKPKEPEQRGLPHCQLPSSSQILPVPTAPQLLTLQSRAWKKNRSQQRPGRGSRTKTGM